MTEKNVLIIDDDGDALISLIRALKPLHPEVGFHGATNEVRAAEILRECNPHVVVLDLSLNEKEGVQSGYRLLEKIKQSDPSCRIIVLTGHGALPYGVTAIQKGASNFIEKPANILHLGALITDGIFQADLRRHMESLATDPEGTALSKIIGISEKIVSLRTEISFAAFTNQPIFIEGASGTGKGLCAQVIHSLSKRKKGRFIRYQPTFSSSDLTNSDLFGHVKGAFTGADRDRRGLIEEASEGTLFLDEIDSLSLETQILLLGVLQDKEARRVGGNTQFKSDFRLLSASNANLKKQVGEKKFREDLYFRIAHHTIAVPPLNDRKEDIPSTVDAIMQSIRQRDELSVFGITESALTVLCDYDWPGNVRELQGVVEGALYRAQFHNRFEIDESDIVLSKEKPSVISGKGQNGVGFHEQILEYKVKLVNEALEQNAHNQVKTAKALGLDRSTLRRLITANLKA